MLIIVVAALYSICYVAAFVVGLERKEIAFTSAQEYALAPQEPVYAPEVLDHAQAPIFAMSEQSSTTFAVQARPTTIWRPRNRDALQHARWRSLHLQESESVEWEPINVLGPDIEDKHTLSQLARMTGNAYALPGKPNWYDMDEAWNMVCLGIVRPRSKLIGAYVRAFLLAGRMPPMAFGVTSLSPPKTRLSC